MDDRRSVSFKSTEYRLVRSVIACSCVCKCQAASSRKTVTRVLLLKGTLKTHILLYFVGRFLISDDDAVWFVGNLEVILAKYDPDDLIYLGNISEDNHQLLYHGTREMLLM